MIQHTLRVSRIQKNSSRDSWRQVKLKIIKERNFRGERSAKTWLFSKDKRLVESYRADRSNTRKRRGANTGGRARHGTASQPASIDKSRLPTGTTLSAGQQMSIALNDSETTMRYASLFPADVSRTSATMRPISVLVLGKMMDGRSSSCVI